MCWFPAPIAVYKCSSSRATLSDTSTDNTMKTFVLCLLLVAAAIAAPSAKPMFKRGRNKIVGGTNADVGEFPYQISFQDTSYLNPWHFCGGSVYSEDRVITAGHCVSGQNFDSPRNLQIVAGDNDFSVQEGYEQAVPVVKIIRHARFNPFTLSNDISLLFLGSSLTFNDVVAAIPIPEPMQAFTGDAVVTGWGALTEGGGSPDILQKVTVPIVSDEACRAAYGQNDILDSMICAGEAGKDSCQGDSGGPLSCGGVLCGIVSWGYGCARPEYYGVYTEVSYFVDWVLTNSA